MEFEKYEDHKAEYIALARKALATPERFTVMIRSESGDPDIDTLPTADAVVGWLKKHASWTVKSISIYDKCRPLNAPSPWTGATFQEADIRAYCAEPTEDLVSRDLYWRACRADSVAAEGARLKASQK